MARKMNLLGRLGLLLGASVFATGVACIDTTGGERLSFTATAAGPARSAAGAMSFDTASGYHVELRRATLYVGGVYLNRSLPTAGVRPDGCYLSGVYAAQVTRGQFVDLLDPTPQPFPLPGEATSDRVFTAEVWLNEGPIDAADNQQLRRPVLDLAGEARRGADTWPFEARLTLGPTWQRPAENPATPGAQPICRERIVSPIAVDLQLHPGGQLNLRIDPRPWFATVHFEDLAPDPANAGRYVFPDDRANSASRALVTNGVQRIADVYDFSFDQPHSEAP